MEYGISINGEWLSLFQGKHVHPLSYFLPRGV